MGTGWRRNSLGLAVSHGWIEGGGRLPPSDCVGGDHPALKVREAVALGIPVEVSSAVAETLVAEAAAAASIAPFQVIEPGRLSLRTRYCATHEGKLGRRGNAAMGYGDTEEAARAHLAEVMAFNFAHNGSLM